MRKRTVRPLKIRLHFKNLMTSLLMKSKLLMLLTSENRHSTVKNQKDQTDKELKEESKTREIQDEKYFYGQTVTASMLEHLKILTSNF